MTDQGRMGSAPTRTVAYIVARKDQGRVGQHLERPLACWVALKRTKGALVCSHEEYMRSQGTVLGKTKDTFGGAREDDNRSSHCLN